MDKAGKTILVVDDERLNINILVDLLEGDYTMLVAKNGEQALKRAHGTPTPDLILLDIMMPGMNGHEVIKHLKGNDKTREIPVIFVTAMGQTEDETTGLDLGAVDYIRKPFNPAVVRARVRTQLALQESYRNLAEHNNLLLYERGLIENIILRMRNATPPPDPDIQTLITPVEKTAGDIVLWRSRPDGMLHILVGDFTGHGLPAAIGAPLADELFQQMTEQGASMASIATAINDKLFRKLPPDIFMAGVLVEWHKESSELRLWNAGMPAPLLMRQGGDHQAFNSRYPPLGVLPELNAEDHDTIRMAAEERLYIHSDGVVETHRSEDGTLFGEQRLIEALQQGSIDTLIEQLKSFRGDAEQADDVTVVALTSP